MISFLRYIKLGGFFLLLLICASCSSTKVATKKKPYHKAQTSVRKIVSHIPDYSASLHSLKGKGKAIVSEPKHSRHVTLYFSSTRNKSLVEVHNSIGIEAGKMLADGDSLLIYDKVDKYARKLSVHDPGLDKINSLASLNILKIINMPVRRSEVQTVLKNDDTYLLELKSGSRIYVNKNTGLIQEIDQPDSSHLPYSKIIYRDYDTIKGLKLPRRITIFSADKSSKVDLLIQSLFINPTLKKLSITLPQNIKIYHQ